MSKKKRRTSKWLAHDVPYLREDLIESTALAADNIDMARTMLRQGGLEKEASDMDYHVTSVLTQHMNLRREDVDMHFVSDPMCQLIAEMHEDLPEWTASQAMPSENGFLIYEKPVRSLPYVTDKAVEDAPLLGFFWHSFGEMVEVVALTDKTSQLVVDNADGTNIFKIGLIYFNANQEMGAGRKSTHVVSHENPLTNPAGFNRNRQFDAISSAIGATWLLMSQESIITDEQQSMRVRNKAQASKVAGHREKAVRDVIVHTRSLAQRSASSQYVRSQQSEREYTKQWWVRGHWRQQACGPKWSERKPVFIEPHVAGPADKPLDDGEKPEVTRWTT